MNQHLTYRGAAEARYFVLLDRELVVIRDFFSFLNIAVGVNYNLLAAINSNNFGIAVVLHFLSLSEEEKRRREYITSQQ